VLVSPTETDWTYAVGERADFQVSVLQDGLPIAGQEITYSIGPEQFPAEETGSMVLKDGQAVIKGLKFKTPGFVRCEVSTEVAGRTYKAWGTAGFGPEKIEAVVKLPADFVEFWDEAKKELAEIPMEPKLTLLPEYCTSKMNVYHLRLNNYAKPNWQGRSSHLYGILAVPVQAGKYPALLNVPGAGARPYGPDSRAEEGLITLNIGIHGIPVNLDTEVYSDLMRGAIYDYWTKGMEDRDDYYYKRVYLGCVRAIDYLVSMDAYDGENLAVTGGSQGGALSIVTAGLDPRVKHLAAFYPALCDLTAYLEGRAGGWPHMFRDFDPAQSPGWLEVAPYFDVVNFARQLTANGWYSWGYNDNVCPPTSMYAAYNQIKAPKALFPALQTAHWTFPEQKEDATAWLMEQLKK
jgi:cephalosporin-C deacetylase-like acetyl esterase